MGVLASKNFASADDVRTFHESRMEVLTLATQPSDAPPSNPTGSGPSA